MFHFSKNNVNGGYRCVQWLDKAAKPLRPKGVLIILQYTPAGRTAARLLWKRYHNDNMNERRANRTYGLFMERSKVLEKDGRIVNKHGGLASQANMVNVVLSK